MECKGVCIQILSFLAQMCSITKHCTLACGRYVAHCAPCVAPPLRSVLGFVKYNLKTCRHSRVAPDLGLDGSL